MGFEQVIKEAHPQVWEQINQEDYDVSFSLNDACSRCGATIFVRERQIHNQWHRDLSFSMNFQLGLLQFIAEKQGWNPDDSTQFTPT